MINIFDMVNGKPVPSAHCFFIKAFKDIMEEYPEDYLQIFAYVLYTTCMDPSLNPYMLHEETTREEVVIADIGPLRFSLEDELVLAAVKKSKEMYQTPVDRFYLAAKVMLDKMAEDMITTELTYGKDGNATIMKAFLKDADDLWASYKSLTVQLLGEQSKARGNIKRAYDQLPGYKNPLEGEKTEDKDHEQDAL
jgi:hypothetical protein